MNKIIALDVTHQNENHPDDRGVGNIYKYDDGTYGCDEYDYVLTEEQFQAGIRDGWIKLIENDK